jgi:hypothetical protein
MTHTARIVTVPALLGGGYAVFCPQGCNLGTSAHQATREGADRRVTLHQTATTPLIPAEPFGVPDPDCRTCHGHGRVFVRAPFGPERSVRCPDCPGDPAEVQS